MKQFIGLIIALLLLINPISLRSDAVEKNKLEAATFAGGCFWGLEHYFKQLPGVVDVKVGYAGGDTANPTYKHVVTGKTGHAESIQILFDPQKISYTILLKHFFRIHEPTSLNRQGNDYGTQYRSAIFYHSPQQLEDIQKLLPEIQKKHYKKIVTQIIPAGKFYLAEEYHQDYLTKNPGGYCHIDMGLLKVPLD
jgi:methionine-S-sulfoxide reductase